MGVLEYQRLTIAVVLSGLVLQSAASDVDALLQLKALAADASSLQSWQAGTNPCGNTACALGYCNWVRVSCQQAQVKHVNLSGVGLHGSLPAAWVAPHSLSTLDLSKNKQLCGSLPATLAASTTVKTDGSSLGQPCAAVGVTLGKPTSTDRGAAGPGGNADNPADKPSTSKLSSLASGMMGAGIGIGVLAGAAAGTLFFLRRNRQGGADGLAEHDLARSCDSVLITKKKKRATTAVPSAFIVQGAGTGQDKPGADGTTMLSSPRQIRMVAFAEGTGSELADEDKQRLRAANIQDSVVIIRNRLASGQLPSGHLSSHKLDITHSSEHSWSSGEDELPCADPEHPAPAPSEAPAQDPMEAVSAAEGGHHLDVHHVVQIEPHSALHQPQLQHSTSKRVQFLGAVPAVVLDP